MMNRRHFIAALATLAVPHAIAAAPSPIIEVYTDPT